MRDKMEANWTNKGCGEEGVVGEDTRGGVEGGG